MRRHLLAFCVLSVFASPAAVVAQGAHGLVVRNDPRAELLAIVFRLAGNREYANGLVPAYDSAIDRHFTAWKGHATVRAARRLREQYGVSFDAVMSYAIHVDDALSPRPRRPFLDPDPSLERRWNAAEADSFALRLREFVRDSRFEEFLAATRPLHDSAQARLERVVREHIDVGELEQFFGRRPNGAFIMVPLLTNASGNFGPRYLEGSTEEVYAVIGTSADSSGIPSFDARLVPTMVHEFSHSFVNPAVAPLSERFRTPAQRIYEQVAPAMRRQAYGSWQTMVNESLVRAAVARYVRAQSGDSAAAHEVAAQQARGFVWTDELYALLGEYEQQRARYPAFDSFLPRVADYFAALAPRLEGLIATYDRDRPKLISVDPRAGADDVDPAVRTIVFRFDKPMGRGVNIMHGSGGPEHYPKVTGFSWDATGTALTLEVELKEEWNYELVLGPGFRSRSGQKPLRDTPVQFRTGAASR